MPSPAETELVADKADLRTVFVISPIAKKNEDGIDFTRIFLDEIVKPAAVLAGGFATPVRGDEVKAPGSVSAKVVADILRADVCVADLTQLNPNVMYEVAIAHAAGKPCILMKQTEKDGTFVPPPFDFIDERTIPYGLLADSANKARDALAEFLRNAHHDEDDDLLARTMNPVRTAFQHQRTQVEAQPADKAVLEQLETLTTQVVALSRAVGLNRSFPALDEESRWAQGLAAARALTEERALVRMARELISQNEPSSPLVHEIEVLVEAADQGTFRPSTGMRRLLHTAWRYCEIPSRSNRAELEHALVQVMPPTPLISADPSQESTGS